ncbi:MULTISPECIES: tellurite resistance TerB family protein [unclassified Anabaena]|uniref:tellurite resistance TerB family protein n=1 Tax=unclassified Anabaena TaxID=2619674 RepID=UPI00082EEECC|nr:MULTISPECIES: tellurite resistance TerB family protein [unclassified Anabaena]
MSNYEQVFTSTQTLEEPLSSEEAVAAIGVVSAISDSGIDEVDAEGLAGILWEFEVFAEYTEDDIIDMVDDLIAVAQNEGVGALLNTATQALSEDMTWDGFAAGVVVLLDPEELAIPPDKQPYLKQLQEALKLTDDEAQEIIQEVVAAFQEGDEEYLDEEEDTAD